MIEAFGKLRDWVNQSALDPRTFRVVIEFSDQHEREKAGLALNIAQREISPLIAGVPLMPIYVGTIYGLPFELTFNPPE